MTEIKTILNGRPDAPDENAKRIVTDLFLGIFLGSLFRPISIFFVSEIVRQHRLMQKKIGNDTYHPRPSSGKIPLNLC